MSKIITFDTPDEAQNAIKADRLCRHIGGLLRKHYPGRQWYVEVTIEGGVAKILCPSISMRYGYNIKLVQDAQWLDNKVVKAGGQILEMFNLSRERGASGGEENILRDARGEALKADTGL